MLESLSNLPLSVWIRESSDLYGFTLILAAHAVGLAIVVGVNVAVALRLLGYASGIPLAALRNFFWIVVGGFTINAISGVLLFIAEPAKMVAMPAFWGKMFLVACGMVVVTLLQTRYFRDDAAVAANRITASARRLAWASLTCWTLALIVGRMTGYPDLVKRYLGI